MIVAELPERLRRCPRCGSDLADVGITSWQNINVPQEIRLTRLGNDRYEVRYEAWLCTNDEHFTCVALHCGACGDELPQQGALGEALGDPVHRIVAERRSDELEQARVALPGDRRRS